jgi:hypothetical protein
MSTEEYCFLSCNTVESSFSPKVCWPTSGPWPLWCQGFKIVDILQGGDVNPTPNPKPGGPCPVSRSKSVQHECPYQHTQWSLVEIYLHFGGTSFLSFFHHNAGGSWFLQLVRKLRSITSRETVFLTTTARTSNLIMFTARVTTLHLDCCYDDT